MTTATGTTHPLLADPFTEQDHALRQSVQRFVEQQVAPRVDAWEHDGPFGDEVFTGLAGLGGFGLDLPAEVGGAGADGWTALVVWQELGRCGSASVTASLAAHGIDGLSLLARWGDPGEVEAAVAGRRLLATCLHDTTVRAERADDGWRLQGRADLVVNGLRAATLLVVAATPDGDRLFVVDLVADGVRRERLDTTSLRGTDVAAVDLDDVVVPATADLAPAADAIELVRERGWLRAALLVAEADLTVREAFDYAAQREVFGRSLDSFQVQQHRLVDLATAVEATHRLVLDVCDKVQRGVVRPDELARLDLAARHLVFEVAEESLQLHGGYGYSQEYRVQRAWRDATWARTSDGGDDARRDHLAALLVDLPTQVPARTVDPSSRLPLYDEDDLRAQDHARRLYRDLREDVDRWELEEDYPRELFERLGDEGLLGHMTPPEDGGTGPAPLRRMAIVEVSHELGSGGLSADIGAHSDLAMVYVNHAGTPEQRERFVRTGVAGTTVGCLGITEPAAGSNVAGITTTATRTDDGWVLNGTKHFITDGAWADWMVVTAKTSVDLDKPHRGISLFVVELDRPGVTRQRMKMLGWRASHTGQITFEDVHVPDDALLGEEGTGFYQIMVNFAWERLTLSWGAVASAEVLLRDAVATARERTVGGRPLVDHDAWRHRLAELSARIEQGRAITEHALRLYAGGADPQLQNRVTAMAKLVTQRLAFDVADELMTTAGGGAQHRDTFVERHWRDARLGPIGGGTDEIMREILKKTYGMR